MNNDRWKSNSGRFFMPYNQKFINNKKILFYQIVQNEYGKIEVNVLPKSGFAPESICNELVGELAMRLKGFQINCSAVKSDKDFVRSTRGKMIMLVQNIKQ